MKTSSLPLLYVPLFLAFCTLGCGGGAGDATQADNCKPGSALTSDASDATCEKCDAGKYCAGGTSSPQICSDDGLIDDDSDPSTPCVPATTVTTPPACKPGEKDDDGDPSTPCVSCSPGTYCAGGTSAEVVCGGTTWDDDSDPTTDCAPAGTCGRNETTAPADGTTDSTCTPCPPHLMPSVVGYDSCDLFSIDPNQPVPTYTVRITGAVIAPFDKTGEEWDTTDQWSKAAVDSVNSVGLSGTYADSLSLASTYIAAGASVPEIYGDARMFVRGFPEARTDLNTAAVSQTTLTPSWADKGFAHVPLTDDTRLLVSLFDDDVGVPDAVSYVMLTGSQLEQAAQIGGPAAIHVWIPEGGRAMWLTVEVTEEGVSESNWAPRALDKPDASSFESYVALSETKRTLWVHGLDFTGLNVLYSYRSKEYWIKDGVTPNGPNPVAVNYHGRAYVSVSNVVLQYELDSLCRSPESCYVACHSAGCAQIGYALSGFSALGTRWNVLQVYAAGSAAGGSELADAGSFTGIGGDLSRDLRVTTMRGLYEHNALGVEVESHAGASGVWISAVIGASLTLPGQDDGAVAYHSSGGVADAVGGHFGSEFGNPGDGSQYVLPVGTGDRSYLFNGHWVAFRDDYETDNHSDIKKRLVEGLKTAPQ